MKKLTLMPTVLSAFLLVTACSHKKDHKKEDRMDHSASYTMPVSQEALESTTANWPESSRAAINALNSKYGAPTSITEDMVVWNTSAPFKQSVVFKEEINHMFPIEHKDVLMQTIDYRVPLDKVSQLSKFDGSLLVDRTKGELSARNDKEEMNILAFNLADKIVRGKMTVEQARREYSKNAEAFAAGTTSDMLTALSFKTEGNTSDPDTMMQSQSEGRPVIRKTIESEEVQKVIED